MNTHPTPPAVPDTGVLLVQMLGRFVVSVGGTELPGRWNSLRAAHLVQLLCLQPGQRAHREAIVDALWPALTPPAGAANLRKAVFHARQMLGRHDAILIEGEHVQLWPHGPIELDVEAFEHQARAALRHTEPAACAAAAALNDGDLLPGTRYEAWTEAARERLHSTRLDLLRASGQWEQVARLDATDEPAHQRLMEQALEQGNRAAALHWYAHLREALQSELGMAPGAGTQALYARCTQGLQATGPTLVGRTLELAQIAAWLAAPPSRRPGGIVLTGPAGIGKSALGREAELQARGCGWASLRVAAPAAGRAYGLTRALAGQLVLQDRSVLDRIGEPARSVIARITPLAEPARKLPGPLGRHQVVGAVRRLLLAAHGGGPLLLCVDDAHLSQAADAEVLMQLATAGAPLCLLLTLRPMTSDAPLSHPLDRLVRAGALQRIDLGPMEDAAMRRLVRAVSPASTTDSAIERVVAAARGHPFVAVAIGASAVFGASGRMPASSAQAIVDRLCDAAPTVLPLARWIAVAGDPCDVAMVEVLCALAQVPGFASLDAALQTGLLVVADGRYRFQHELVRDAITGQIAPHERLRMHRRMAAALAASDGDPARIAAHWEAGGLPRKGLPCRLAAARDAMRLAAFGDALQHLDAVLALDAAHAEALRLRAEALDAQGDPAALFAYRLAAAAAGEPDSHDLRAKAALAQVKLGDPHGALLALDGVHPVSVEGRLCEALAWSGAAALGAADPGIGTAKAAVARRLALETGDTSSLVIASWAQAAAAHARGELHRSVWADLQETSHVPHLAVRVFDGHLCITQRFLYGAKPYREVIGFAQALATEASRLGAARGLAFATTLRGEAEWLSGDTTSARVHLREGASLHRAIHGPVGEALSLQRLAEVSLHEGRRNEARALIDEALDLARQTDIGFHLLDRIYGTRIALHGDDPAAALHVLEDASASVRGPLETCPGCRITFAVPAAIAAARAGQVDVARRHEEQCAYLADVVMRLPAWHAAHTEVRAHIGAAEKRPADETVAQFAAAAEAFRAAGQPLDAARCADLAARVAGAGSLTPRR